MSQPGRANLLPPTTVNLPDLDLSRAQQPIPIVGFVHAGEAKPTASFVSAFSQGLKDAGYVEGQTVSVEYRWAEGHLERIPALVLELVRRPVAVILTGGGDVPTLVAKGATATIPIVFVIGDDPVASGLVASLNRPGGNVTGATLIASELGPKRVEMTFELLPLVSAVAILLNPNNPQSAIDSDITQEALRAKRKEVHVLHASNREEIGAAFTALPELKIGALLLIPDPLFQSSRTQIIALAARHSVPTMYYTSTYAASGGLISYGASFAEMYRQMGGYVGKILKGARPADLPVMQPSKFELVINLKTAKTLGLNVPPSLLAQATEVIE
jgi:putative tryptophan/tyrosine transport system substrate-binding protein